VVFLADSGFERHWNCPVTFFANCINVEAKKRIFEKITFFGVLELPVFEPYLPYNKDYLKNVFYQNA
jgi:hypothetical protein